jgi:hypothetical protein
VNVSAAKIIRGSLGGGPCIPRIRERGGHSDQFPQKARSSFKHDETSNLSRFPDEHEHERRIVHASGSSAPSLCGVAWGWAMRIQGSRIGCWSLSELGCGPPLSFNFSHSRFALRPSATLSRQFMSPWLPPLIYPWTPLTPSLFFSPLPPPSISAFLSHLPSESSYRSKPITLELMHWPPYNSCFCRLGYG